MRLRQLLNSFRARLVLLLVVLLGLTLGVQYYVNLRQVRRNARMLVAEEQAIMAGVALGVNSISSNKYLDQIKSNVSDQLPEGRVRNVLVIDGDGNVLDSLDQAYAPVQNPDKSTRYVHITEVPLAHLTSAVKLSDESEPLPAWLNASSAPQPGEPAAFYFPVETQKGRWYVIVVLGSASTLTNILERQPSLSALYTLLLLLQNLQVPSSLVLAGGQRFGLPAVTPGDTLRCGLTNTSCRSGGAGMRRPGENHSFRSV